MRVRYYCSGFDLDNIFGHGLGEMLKSELIKTKNIVYIPGGASKVEKARTKYIPLFTAHFKNVGINFKSIDLITPDLLPNEAQELVKNADFIMLMGGDPFKQKEMCENLGITEQLRQYNGVMLGFSAGAMFMSKYIIVTPCSAEYPEFRIEQGLDLDGLSVYPHNNTSCAKYPDELISHDETYKKADLIQVAKEYGKFYLLQDNKRENGLTDVSIIKCIDGKMELYTENDGKIWAVGNDVKLINNSSKLSHNMLKAMKSNKEL